jgi:hypothetical protein
MPVTNCASVTQTCKNFKCKQVLKRNKQSLIKQSPTNNTFWRFAYEQRNKYEDCAYVAALS